MQVRVRHSINDLGFREKATRVRKEAPKIVRDNAREGNRIAKAFASEQHTMYGDEDIEYAPSFTVEKTGPMQWEYGADSAIGDGSQSPGYEHGSINSPPHHDHLRSFEAIVPEFHNDIDDMLRWVFAS